jgi:hypothetical protein
MNLNIASTTFLADISTASTQLFDGLEPVIAFVVGVLLALLLIEAIVEMMDRRRKGWTYDK